MKNESTQNLDKIHDFLRNQLSEEDKENFQKEITDNKATKEAMNLSRDIGFVLENQALFEVNHYIKTLQETQPPTFPQKKKETWKWFVIVAGVIGIISFFGIKPQLTSTPTIEKTALGEFLNLYDYSVSFTDEGNQQGQNAFEAREYEKAINLFEKTLLVKEDKNVRLLWGIAKLRSHKNIEEVIVKLEELEKNAPSYMKAYVHWYLGLAYLEKEELEAAVLQFNQLQGTAPFEEKIPVILDLM